MTDSPALTDADFAAAVDQAQAAAKSYYDTGDVLMTDADYDALLDRITAAKRAHPEWDDRGVTTRVAAGVSSGGDVRHPVPMMSLDKVTSDDEVREFIDSLA